VDVSGPVVDDCVGVVVGAVEAADEGSAVGVADALGFDVPPCLPYRRRSPCRPCSDLKRDAEVDSRSAAEVDPESPALRSVECCATSAAGDPCGIGAMWSPSRNAPTASAVNITVPATNLGLEVFDRARLPIQISPLSLAVTGPHALRCTEGGATTGYRAGGRPSVCRRHGGLGAGLAGCVRAAEVDGKAQSHRHSWIQTLEHKSLSGA
jgi:hypothetical protein